MPCPRRKPPKEAATLVWKSRIYPNIYGGVQTVNLLDIDLTAPGLEVKP